MAEANEDELALVTAALREVTEAMKATRAVVETVRAESRDAHRKVSEGVSDLTRRVAALARDLKAMTPPPARKPDDREARYVWGSMGFVVGILLCAAFFFLAAGRHS